MNKDLKKSAEESVKLKKDGTIDRRTLNKGGVRAGAGRKRGKAKVVLITKLDELINGDKVVRKLKQIMYNDEDRKLQLDAIKLYMAYRFGKPVETKEVNIFKEQPLFVLGDKDRVVDIDYEDVLEDILKDEEE